MDVEDRTIVVYSDIGCPWSHVAVHRLHETRARLGLTDVVLFDHRAFPLELFNDRPTPKATLDAEMPVTAALEPEAGWRAWSAPIEQYPVSTLLALEAVQAAKEQSLRASELLDRALRRALFARNECISMFHVVMQVAKHTPQVNAGVLHDALEAGGSRQAIFAQMREAKRIAVEGSPHLFLADGSDFANPGVEKEWICGDEGTGFPVVRSDDPAIYETILRRAAQPMPRSA